MSSDDEDDNGRGKIKLSVESCPTMNDTRVQQISEIFKRYSTDNEDILTGKLKFCYLSEHVKLTRI
jgi:hypothetical protein